MGVDPKPKHILKLWRLNKLHEAVFVKLEPDTIKMLKIIEPYVAFGYPSFKTIQDLIHKRGFTVVNNEKLPINDNQIVENALKKNKIICVEDLINEIFIVGPSFAEVSKFLCPFELREKKYKKKMTEHFKKGGYAGNNESAISKFIDKII